MPTKTGQTQKEMPGYVRRNLDYFLDHEHEDPERYGALIMGLSLRWGI